MCGIAGFLDLASRASRETLQRLASAMADTLRHRGPDGGGVWVDEAAGIALAHRRLAIVDLSSAGQQPMVSSCGRYVISYNGEIYNAPELRAELDAAGGREAPWRGRSDTEVIVEGCAAWGVEAATRRLIGMFAFALWDRRERRLHLVRDRLGIKPLYWGRAGGGLVFGSELKALRSHPEFAGHVDRDALAGFLRYGYVPGPHAIYKGVRKLMPGCILTLAPGAEPVEAAYWSMAEVARQGQADRLDLGDGEAVDSLGRLLGDAVARRMVADVPLGAFLSGGVDSSTVVALMQAASSRPVRSFSIGFREAGYDEAVHARAVARHLGTDHTELYVEASHARDVIPRLPEMFDEPFADASQIPTLLVSELTRRHVTVSLSGDGGDELFAGYTRHAIAAGAWGRVGRLPAPLRHAAAGALRALPPRTWSRLFELLPGRLRQGQAGDKLYKLADVLAGPPEELYRRLVSQWQDPAALVPGAREPVGPASAPALAHLVPGPVERMQYLDTVTYLPDDILTKVDRASMAVSLEARVPLLDHRVVEFAWRLPMAMKIRNGQTKWLLRQVLYRHVPPALIERPKMGFGVPIDTWLRGPLRDWAEELLDEARLRREGWFDPAPIRRRWCEHLSGSRNWQYPLWTVLMFQAWLEREGHP